jgi:hypothetical protein
MFQRLVSLFILVVALAVAGCAPRPTAEPADIDALAAAIRNLGPGVDPAEADRAARIAYLYSQQLAQEYRITDPPLIHNAKVHSGERERGLCNHWAEDLSRRLREENFTTLTILRAISPPKPFRIIHHTTVITPRGGTIYDGIVLDPWRHGGALFWARTPDDDHYNWRPRHEVVQELLKARGLPATPATP